MKSAPTPGRRPESPPEVSGAPIEHGIPGPMKVALCFGGPSDERNISAGSLKPWVTWLGADPDVSVEVVYFDRERQAWRLPETYAYTNTCEDFESQLPADARLDETAFAVLLQAQDVVVPLIHGAFGEDGELQARLEELGVPYVFSDPAALARTFDKRATYAALAGAGLPAPAHFTFDAAAWAAEPEALHARALALGAPIRELRCAVKPNRGGSSLGVSLVDGARSSFDKAVAEALAQDGEVLVEALLGGTEVSVVVLETESGPVALPPTEVETDAAVYDTRAKYLHGSGARLHTPARDGEAIPRLREAALAAWRACGLRDMARIDAFLAQDGAITVTDINGISGMGFSSFAFLQTSLVGVGHAELVRGLIARAARRGGGARFDAGRDAPSRGRVHVLFGGPTSERQVSRQSGIFVGLALEARGYDVRFVFMDRGCRFTEIGSFLALHHDVEEIAELIASPERRAIAAELGERIAAELAGSDFAGGARDGAACRHVGRTTDLAGAVADADFAFLALHGGPGEDGTLQAGLEVLGIPYNGCGPEASRLCADKVHAVQRVAHAALPAVGTPRQREVRTLELLDWLRGGEWSDRFKALANELGSPLVIGKPAADGCSTGVKLLGGAADLETFARAIVSMRSSLPAGAFGPGSRALQLPEPPPERWLFEEAFVDPGAPPLPGGDWNADNLRGWIDGRRYLELTCAVCSVPDRGLVAAVPSLTVARAAELSLEEKFQQGVGTNLELDAFFDDARVRSIRGRVEALAGALGLEGYARLDVFYDQREDRVLLLEANTLCALTEATVFYSQMLASFGAAPPLALDWIVRAGRERAAQARSSASAAQTSMPV